MDLEGFIACTCITQNVSEQCGVVGFSYRYLNVLVISIYLGVYMYM